MNLPLREALLDIDWLTRTHAAEGFEALQQCWKLRDFGCRDISCALAFAPDGQRLVVAGWEGVLRRVVLPAS